MSQTTLDDLVNEVEQALAIDPDKLDGEAIRQVNIFTLIQRHYIRHTRKLEELIRQQEQVKNNRQRYYGGKASAEEYKKNPLREAILKSDVDQYVKIDPLMIEITSLVNEQSRLVKYLEDAKAQLKERSYDIRLAIDFKRTNQGG